MSARVTAAEARAAVKRLLASRCGGFAAADEVDADTLRSHITQSAAVEEAARTMLDHCDRCEGRGSVHMVRCGFDIEGRYVSCEACGSLRAALGETGGGR